MPAAVAERSGALPHVGSQQHSLTGPPPEGFAADSGGLLFKQVTPRRRQDQFGRDNTRHADYLLSMAVFPTGVRAPLLSDLQKKTEHQCGFEVVEKAAERSTAGGGRHVHIRDSKAESEVSHRGSALDSAKKPPPNTPLTASLKLSADRATQHSQSISVSPSTRRSTSREKHRWVHSSAERTGASHTGKGDGKMKDIRDPLYLNTYCPEERKLRYKKSSLPRLSNRTRPWTVSEPNPSYRFARNSHEVTSEKQGGRRGKSAWPTHNALNSGHFRIDARDIIARAKGKMPPHVQNDSDGEESEEEQDESVTGGQQALLEVKSYFPVADTMLCDQRDNLRGKDGCLHAKVKQCIKFVKYREKLARCTSVERPLKSEGGRYRPFSTTTIRTPRAAPTSSNAPRHPDPTSVEIYKEYIDTIALQTRLVSAADKRRKPRAAVSGGPRYNTAASSYQDSVLQSISDSNRPSPTNVSVTDKTTKGSESGNPHAQSSNPSDKDQDSRKSQNGGPDPRGVHHALDIIRLSPKAQPPRSSRISKGGRSYREEAEAEEGEKAEKEEGKQKPTSHAIFLPNVSKSATTSVCSFAEESGNAAET